MATRTGQRLHLKKTVAADDEAPQHYRKESERHPPKVLDPSLPKLRTG